MTCLFIGISTGHMPDIWLVPCWPICLKNERIRCETLSIHLFIYIPPSCSSINTKCQTTFLKNGTSAEHILFTVLNHEDKNTRAHASYSVCHNPNNSFFGLTDWHNVLQPLRNKSVLLQLIKSLSGKCGLTQTLTHKTPQELIDAMCQVSG